jgi:hypothetical protein
MQHNGRFACGSGQTYNKHALVQGFESYMARRKGRLDKAIDSELCVSFTEAADYRQFQRH